MTTTRLEHDLLGDREVPHDAYWGVHTLRAVENFPITGQRICDAPDLIVQGALPDDHPLILAAVLVWMSIELIGDGLLAARSLLVSVSSERNVTPS